MDPELTSFKTMFDYKLEPEVYNFHLLDALIKAAEKEGITNFPVSYTHLDVYKRQEYICV